MRQSLARFIQTRSGEQNVVRYLLVALFLVVIILCGLLVGAVRVTPGELFQALRGEHGLFSTIIVDIRLPRVITAACTGASLAAAGCAFQGIFRNALADPYIIGSSSGAALGATVAIVLNVTGSVLGLAAVPFSAFIGSLGSVLLVFGVASRFRLGSHNRARATSPVALLLAGTAISTMIGAAVALLVVLNNTKLESIYVWLLGSFSGASWKTLAASAPYMVVGAAVLILAAPRLDMFAFGEDTAQTLGLPVASSRFGIAAAGSLVVAAAVAVGGTIGFVGLIAPHASRALFGPKHRASIPGACLIGAILLVIADIAARGVAAPTELPVGVFTAFLGAPFFLYILAARGLQGGWR